MDLQELQRLVESGESETLEFKRSLTEREAAAKTICAMLNSPQGGLVVFGVKNDGSIQGVEIGAETHDRIRGEIGRIDPPIVPALTTIPISDARAVLLLSVPGNTGVFRFLGRPYAQLGASTSLMPEMDYQRRVMDQLHSVTRWENRPASHVALDDLDRGEIVITVEEAIRNGRLADPGTRDTRSLLNGLNLMADGQLLNAAVVLFGASGRIDPWYPQCTIRLARFRGTTKDEFVDSRQVVGNSFVLFRNAQQFMLDHLPVASRIPSDSFQREDRPKYPVEALREGLINALCHRDYAEAGGGVDVAIYDDRLEIVSTGGLRFGLTVEELSREHQSRPWNPLIANTFYRRGLIESWGRGTLRMGTLFEELRLPHPEFEDSHFSFTVRFRIGVRERPTPRQRGLNELQVRILDLLSEHGDIPLRDIHRLVGDQYTEGQVRRSLRSLREAGVVEQSGSSRASVWSIIRKATQTKLSDTDA